MRNAVAAVAVSVALLAALGSCSRSSSSGEQPTAGSAPTNSTPSSGAPARLPTVGRPTDVATGLSVPWGLAFLPDGSALVAERPTGRVVRIGPDGGTSDAGTVPGVRAQGEGGMLGLAVAPDDPATVFAYFTSTDDDNRVVRIPYRNGRLGRPTALLTGIPAAGNHDGGRIVVGPDGNLWIGTGDAGRSEQAQDRGALGGKILRIRRDGSVPPDNPFPSSPVWSYGHRNVQGLAWDSNGNMYASEFGQDTWDELNLIVKGHNYGWPVIEGFGHRQGYTDPLRVWPTDEASPSGIAIVNDVVYMAALRGERLWRIPLTRNGTGAPHALLTGTFGRLRAVVRAPDGGLWLLTNNTARGTPRAGDDKLVEIPLPS
jgi:glucose/arabinose dehydrogenase